MRCKNFFALGLMFWLYDRDRRDSTLEWIAEASAKTPNGIEPTCARSRPATTSAKPRSCSEHSYEVPPGQARARRVSQHHRQRGARRSASSPRPSWRGCSCSSASYPITPACDILHELATHKHFGVKHVPGRRRDRGRRRGDRRELRRRARAHHHERPGHRAQGRGDRPGGRARAAAGHRRRPARRPEHGPADQDRAGRPAAGDVRPQRRVAAAGRRRAQPGRLLLRGDRGVPHRGQAHDAGDPADRRLHRQRRRAVAGAGDRATCRASRCKFRTEPRRLRALPARRERWRGRGRSRARRASSTASAASRRSTSPATSATTRTTTSRCARIRAESVERIADVLPADRGARRPARRPARARLGRHVRRDPRRRRAHARARPQDRPRAAAPPQPVPARPRRDPASASSACSCPSSTWASSCS